MDSANLPISGCFCYEKYLTSLRPMLENNRLTVYYKLPVLVCTWHPVNESLSCLYLYKGDPAKIINQCESPEE